MFKKKKCPRCGGKLNKDYDFCPYCGKELSEKDDLEKLEKDFGLLGKEDFSNIGIKLPFGFNKLFNSLLSQVDKQFKELDKEIAKDVIKKEPRIHKSGISISINASGDQKPVIKVKRFGNGNSEDINLSGINNIKEVKPKVVIDEETARRISKLPKKEASTKVRRMSNRIVYEIDLPGVKSIKDVIINKLENSIEIKAFSKDKAYFKFLPINLPILKYGLEKGKLMLELAEE